MNNETRKVVEYTDRSLSPMAYTITVDRGTRQAYAYGAGMMEVTRRHAANVIRGYRMRAARVARDLGKGNTITITVHALPPGVLDFGAGATVVRRYADCRTWMEIERVAVEAKNAKIAQAKARNRTDAEPAGFRPQ